MQLLCGRFNFHKTDSRPSFVRGPGSLAWGLGDWDARVEGASGFTPRGVGIREVAKQVSVLGCWSCFSICCALRDWKSVRGSLL